MISVKTKERLEQAGISVANLEDLDNLKFSLAGMYLRHDSEEPDEGEICLLERAAEERIKITEAPGSGEVEPVLFEKIGGIWHRKMSEEL